MRWEPTLSSTYSNMETLEYVDGSDIRIRFDTGTSHWACEQVRINEANGATFDEYSRIREIDLGPFTSNDPLIQSAVAVLATLIV